MSTLGPSLVAPLVGKAVGDRHEAGSNGGPADKLVLHGRQVVPVLDQHQVLLDFEFDKSQSRLKFFLACELEERLFVFGVGVFKGD